MAQPLSPTLRAWSPTLTTDDALAPSYFTFLPSMFARSATGCAIDYTGDQLADQLAVSPESSCHFVSAHTMATSVLVAQRPRTPASSAKRPLNWRSSATRRPLAPKLVHRIITNDTYLRRLHLSPQHAATLFPCLSRQLVQITNAVTPKNRRAEPIRIARDFELVTAQDARWPATFECTVSRGKLHCRLVGGWSRFCRDNGVRVNDAIMMECRRLTAGAELMVGVKRGAQIERKRD